jgi:fatty acid desaturase
MKFSHAATLLAVSVSTTSAFQSVSRSTSFVRPTTVSSSRRYAVAIDIDPPENAVVPPAPKLDEDAKVIEEPFDMTGIAMSGLQGKALKWKASDFPSARDLRSVIPKDCFKPETKTSLKYLSVSVIGTALCSLFGAKMLSVFNPASLASLPFWTGYSAVTGTVAMGLWVLAHECGHGAFSKNKTIQDTVGYWLHSLFLVPYYSWQRSHAVHHQYTNHMELGETHVPETDEGHSLGLRDGVIKGLGKRMGVRMWGVIQSFLHLVIGWPAYLAIGATGGPDRGMTNHFWPNPLTTPKQPKRELFPGNWKAKVLKSDIGVVMVASAAGALAWFKGMPLMMAMYGGPLIVVNAWLVLYTWLQHTDVDVPHFSNENHSFVKGALHTIDRPYDKLDPWGFIDFLHHKIGTTHVAHHFDSTIPHYKAEVATNAIKEAYPDMYLHDPTPIPKALWRIAKGCTAVEKRGDKWVWNNKGLEAVL